MKSVLSLMMAVVLLVALLTGCRRPPPQPEPEESSAVSQVESLSEPPEASQAPSQAVEALPKLTLEGAPVKQGRVALLKLGPFPQGEELPAVTVETDLGFTPTFFPHEDGLAALVPVRYTLEPGNYHMEILWDGEGTDYEITVVDGEFEVEEAFEIPIGPSTDTSAANAEFSAVVRPLRAVSDPVKYWQGTFALPLQMEALRVSSQFGYTRIINDNIDRHGGVDFPADADTPVYAPAAGRVQFAGWLELTGYTICIEHGMGLKSWYYHMNGVTVEAEQMVETGQQIGLVGSTGIFTTGAHLHFALTVNDVFVDPWQFLETAVLD